MNKVLKRVLLLGLLLLMTNIVSAADCDFQTKKKISFVDVTFCSNNLVTQLAQGKLNEYRDEYKKYFGDVTIERDDSDATQTSVTWKPVNVPPTGSTATHCQGKNQLAVTTLTCELATAKWDNLMIILKELCGGTANKPPTKLQEASEEYLKSLEKKAESYNSMTIPEVRFSEYSAQSFLELYRTFSNDATCDYFNSPAQYKDLWLLYGKKRSASGEILTDDQRANFGFNNYYFTFVTNVAYHHALSVMLHYATMVNTAIETLNDDQRKALSVLLSELNRNSAGVLANLQSTQLNIAKGVIELNDAVAKRVSEYKESGFNKG